MRTGWFIVALVGLAAGCQETTRGAGQSCDSSLDCPVGTWCSLSTRTCVEPPSLDATTDTQEPDAATTDVTPDVAVGCEQGAPCDDLDPCTHGDSCKDGACKGTSYTCDDGIPCTVDTCDGLGSCAYTVAAGKCFIGGACFAAGADPAEPCRQCVPAMSQGDWQLSDGVPCEDGDPCTTGDACTTGVCTTGGGCDDGNPCTDDTCEAETGCAHTPNEAPCDDGDPCTGPDACADGQCTGQACLCACSTDDDCESALVDPCLGPIVCAPGPEGCGTQCQVDTTQAVTCDTSGDTECVTTACNPATAACEATSAPDGTPCDDGIASTSGDVCTAGVCAGEDESCLCEADADCAALDDDNLCNGTLACKGCQCFIDPKTVVTCSGADDTQCTKAACMPATGACAQQPVTDGTPCDDGDGDTTDDVCTAGICKGS